ncbi:MAG: four helix bundle protein [Flexilinea sp.]|nr:four helix bundle protein [Flexilinea sp.]
MAAVYDYRDLIVWQKSVDLAVLVHETVKCLPKEELFCLSSQIRRAAISIPSNIAEGHQRGSARDYLHFIYIAKGSLAELETQILLCERLGYINDDKLQPINSLCSEIGKMLNTLRNKLQESISGNPKNRI